MGLIGAVLLVIALVVAFSILGATISIVYYLVTGLVVGAIARLVLPGRENIGLLGTALVGIAGSTLGGVAGRLIHAGLLIEFVVAVVASAILLTVLGFRAR